MFCLFPVSHPAGYKPVFCPPQVDFNPALVPVFSEGLRLCGTWLAETCLESPGVVLEQYLEKVPRPSARSAPHNTV